MDTNGDKFTIISKIMAYYQVDHILKNVHLSASIVFTQFKDAEMDLPCHTKLTSASTSVVQNRHITEPIGTLLRTSSYVEAASLMTIGILFKQVPDPVNHDHVGESAD